MFKWLFRKFRDNDPVSSDTIKNYRIKAVYIGRGEDKPPLELAPVVRCKDCVWWEDGDCYRQELTLPTDFCSYGKRKDGAE